MHVLVAMSGGVDSSTAAALLIEQGHRVEGVTLRLWDGMGASATPNDAPGDNEKAAGEACRRLGIPHSVLPARELFVDRIVRPFCDAYLAGKTPNPCVVCNQRIKFELLLRRAAQVGADFLATGHYAHVEVGPEGARLLKGADPGKDQSYFLHRVAPADLRRVLFPLGSLTKAETKRIAQRLGLAAAARPESQEICFLPDGGYRKIVERFGRTTPRPGRVLYQGKELYRHEGIHLFTIGQRSGASTGPGKRLFVTSIDPATGDIEVDAKERLLLRRMTVNDIVWQRAPAAPVFEAEVKIRYRHAPAPAAVTILEDGRASVLFRRPQSAITPGQAAVFYDQDRVLGGGWIESGEAECP